MSAALQRVTTAYVADEDRLRLTGELSDGDAVVLWLTQRLLNRLVPHLTAWLARQTGSFASTVPPAIQSAHHNIVQGFAQQSARAQLKPEPPVRAASRSRTSGRAQAGCACGPCPRAPQAPPRSSG